MLTFVQFINSDIYESYIEEKNSNKNNMTHKEIHKHISSKGWSVARQSGSHDIYKHTEHKHIIEVPRGSGNLAPGTVRDILKKAG
jgi:predicted RNA binding protein YcfA (HicA-like mRNA interferase family)